MEADETWGSTNLNKSESATQLISDAEDGPLLEASTELIPLKPTGQQPGEAANSCTLPTSSGSYGIGQNLAQKKGQWMTVEHIKRLIHAKHCQTMLPPKPLNNGSCACTTNRGPPKLA